MSRGQTKFRAAEVSRAIKGTEAAGKTVASIKVDRDGTIVIICGDPAGAAPVDPVEEMIARSKAHYAAQKGRQRANRGH